MKEHPWRLFFPHPPYIAAHRGYRSRFPENTRAAFTGSLGRCDYIELDVRLTRDEIPVVIHDATLTRTSNIDQLKNPFSGENRVSHLLLSELVQLDMGSWFLAKDPFQTIASGKVDTKKLEKLLPQQISTLFEILDWAAKQDLPINIELKDLENSKAGETLVNRVLYDIDRAKMTDRVLISSFNHHYLQFCSYKNHRIATAALVEEQHPENLMEYLSTLNVIAYHPADDMVDSNLIAELGAKKILVNVYTVNDPNRKKELFEMGVHSVFTDFLE
ncbi:glycerophosphodiester phosphodiesterase [Desulfogranum japonicum]|uniref:glycerophosphodiester phosphodiesterase n=1 Tax=Desulfogranum japonicum TaxID=231447 RepID=UPI0004222190|nr:glycerophosphodiester phosphodiesterase family protein [Desulfogranum japonicum]